MSKPRPASETPKSEAPATGDSTRPEATKAPAASAGHKDGTRETIESIIVAFILAFLFRTFEAEAFVIPTGSMAPTLFGRHKDVTCPQCKYRYQIGASEEVDNDGRLYIPGNRIKDAACPNCRFVADVKDLPVYKGDRILVNKFMYEFEEPQRWDVLVFKYPENPTTNYIKRLIGLPGEKLEIRQGDIYIHRDGGIELQRKEDPYKQRELQQLVYDDDHPETLLHEHGWPERWAAMRKTGKDEAAADAPAPIAGWSKDENGWTLDRDARRYQIQGELAQNAFRWLRYRHFVPTEADWNAVTASPPKPLTTDPQPQLITDFCGYNAYEAQWRDIEEGVYWVGDLTLSAYVTVEKPAAGAQILLELVEGSRRYRCRISLDSGAAELLMQDDLARGEQDDGTVLATATTDVQGAGSWSLSFANVDDRLCLWIDGRLVPFNDAKGVVYQPYAARALQRPWEEDLVPAGIAARGATVAVSHLRLERDVYYRGEYIRPQDFDRDNPALIYKEYLGDEASLRKLVSRPEEWGELYERRWIRNDPNVPEHAYVFNLAENEYFMMGDNSPRSKDSRLWPQALRGSETLHRHAVQRTSLVGKAFFIYWPHGKPFLNNGRGYPDGEDSLLNNDLTARWFYHREPVFNRNGEFVGAAVSEDYYPSFRIPFYPNIGRMQRIR